MHYLAFVDAAYLDFATGDSEKGLSRNADFCLYRTYDKHFVFTVNKLEFSLLQYVVRSSELSGPVWREDLMHTATERN